MGRGSLLGLNCGWGRKKHKHWWIPYNMLVSWADLKLVNLIIVLLKDISPRRSPGLPTNWTGPATNVYFLMHSNYHVFKSYMICQYYTPSICFTSNCNSNEGRGSDESSDSDIVAWTSIDNSLLSHLLFTATRPFLIEM